MISYIDNNTPMMIIITIIQLSLTKISSRHRSVQIEHWSTKICKLIFKDFLLVLLLLLFFFVFIIFVIFFCSSIDWIGKNVSINFVNNCQSVISTKEKESETENFFFLFFSSLSLLLYFSLFFFFFVFFLYRPFKRKKSRTKSDICFLWE